jgi:hypothetical protein
MELRSAQIWKLVSSLYPKDMPFIQILDTTEFPVRLHLSDDRCGIYSYFSL